MPRPDEGMIHAWLDGELDAPESARVAALVRDDPEWAAAAAEARGFIAASARIVGSLDHVPANVIPKAAAGGPSGGGTKVTSINAARGATARATPWWAMRIAALLVVAVGTVIVSRRAPDDAPVAGALDDSKGLGQPLAIKAPRPNPLASNARASTAKQPPATARGNVRARGEAFKDEQFAAAEQRAKEAGPPAGAAGNALARRDLADQSLRVTLDSVARKPRADSEAKPADAKKTALSEKTLGKGIELSSVVTTSVSSEPTRPLGARSLSLQGTIVDRPSIEECYRDAVRANAAATDNIRVRRLNDTTAVFVLPTEVRQEAANARVAQAASGAAAAARPAAPPAQPQLRLRGDTLFLSNAAGPARLALKVSCQPR